MTFQPHFDLSIGPCEGGIEEGSQIITIVIGRILLGVIAWREHRLLVPVDAVIVEESPCLLIDLSGREAVSPEIAKLLEHAPDAQLLDFTQSSEYRELIVLFQYMYQRIEEKVMARACYRHSHVRFVGLDILLGDGFKLGCWGCVQYCVQYRKLEGVPGIGDETLEVGFRDASDGINIRRRAIVLCEIASKTATR